MLGTLLMATITVGVGLAVPQDGTAPPLSSKLGLDHLFSGWWFRAVAALISLQLLAAVARLWARDMRRIQRPRGPASPARMTVLDPSGLADALRMARYRRVHRSVTQSRYVRNLWGYLGPTLLHVGLLTAMVAVLVNALSISTGNVAVFEGATLSQGTSLANAQEGPLGRAPVLEQALRCDAIDIAYWPDGSPREIAGQYSFVGPDGEGVFRVATNAPVVIDGLRIFQDTRVGYAYGVTLWRAEQTMKWRIDLPLPESGDAASYADVQLENGDLLQAKVTHDPAAVDTRPVLTLRLVRNGEVIGERSFDDTGSGEIGDTTVSVDVAARWGIISLERSHGMGLLFAGFFAILAGATLIYAAAPRELTLMKHEDGTVTADWRAARFATLYANEERALREAATGTKERLGG